MLKLIALVLSGASCAGCFSPTKRVYRRAAIEQQVTAVAIERAIDGLKLKDRALPAHVVLRVTAPRDADKDLIRSVLTQRLASCGTYVNSETTLAVPVLEAQVLYAGSDAQLSLLGIPIALPLGVSLATDISIWKTETQKGRARLGMLLWNERGALLEAIEAVQAEASYTNWTILTFIGPFRWTDIEHF